MHAAGRPPRLGSSWLLALGVALLALLLALTTRSIYREWRQQIGQSRADAIFRLVQNRGPMRPTDTPGASAWLNLEIKEYRRLITDPAKARLYGEVADWPDTASVPPSFEPIRRTLATPLGPPSPTPALRLAPPADPSNGPLPLRRQRFLEAGKGRWLVVTRRRGLDAPTLDDLGNPSNRFLVRAAPHLLELGSRLGDALARQPLPPLPGDRPPRVARLYALAEDGTLLSLPLYPEPGGRQAALAEGREFRKLPELPTFVSNEFFFRFDFSAPQPQCFYSGLYLDLGGQGVVATITVPEHDDAAGERWLVGADLTFDMDWPRFARQIAPPMLAEAVRLPETPPDRWQPWTAMRAALPSRGPASLHRAVSALAEREPHAEPAAGQPNVLHGVTAGQGAVAAFQVAQSTWLLVLFPRTSPHLPLVPVSLSVGVLALLLVGLERNRRRAERAQRKAEGELQEKQNLLNTMQVPLVVVDPNTDEVVSSNRAAEDLGIRPDSRFADLVVPDPRARAHYERMQVAGPETRRAYGVPVRVRGEEGGEETRYAVVRSVAVTAPIEALSADERHRLGVLFLLDLDADLALLTEDLTGATRGDERRRLAGLLTHGVDLPARVLAHTLGRAGSPAGIPPELTAWLAGYLDARLRTISWLLDHWDAHPPLPPDSSVEVSQARATLERLQNVFALAARDADLRCRLHWDNGALAAQPESKDRILDVEIDWPETHWFPCPVRGGFGFFLSEALINAIRHGRPGSVPIVRIALDRVRRELVFEIENEVRPDARGRTFEPAASVYGGTGILRQLARLFDWEGPWFETAGDRFRVTWKVPVSERGDPRRAD